MIFLGLEKVHSEEIKVEEKKISFSVEKNLSFRKGF